MTSNSVNDMNVSIMSSFAGSKKVYVEGSRPDIKVPMREIKLSPTTGAFGEEENPPFVFMIQVVLIRIQNYSIDIRKGLAPIRRNWVLGT